MDKSAYEAKWENPNERKNKMSIRETISKGISKVVDFVKGILSKVFGTEAGNTDIPGEDEPGAGSGSHPGSGSGSGSEPEPGAGSGSHGGSSGGSPT